MIHLDPMPTAAATAPHDADLVQRCLVDGAPAFAEIVTRYQTLICSLTYNATGSLSRSEDLAQEVFFVAWKELRQLREPEKLRPWLCGIARRLSANTRRREGREPACAAEELQDEHHVPTPGPADQAISREEEAILWRSLERIPETYREPLILFYREEQSVEQVAAALELTEDAAKQRLSRGRKLLQEQVARFVEGALRMSTPGRAFTLGVIAALPLVKTSATAATLGTAAVKTGASATSVGWLSFLALLIGPLAGCLGAWFGVRASLDAAETEEERRLIRRQASAMVWLVIAFLVLMGFAMPFEYRIWHERTGLAVALGSLLPLLYVVALTVMILRFRRAHLRVRAAQAAHRSPEATARAAEVWRTFEYISPWKFLGLPLLHIRTGRPYGTKLRPAIGWIAIGDVAIGVLLSIGGFAVGGISIGGFSLGLMAMGGVSLGAVAFAGLAIGLYGATGGLAIGYFAHGGTALGWHAAEGGMAAARDFAVGQSAWAAHANDAAAREADRSIAFFYYANWLMRHPLLFSIAWCPVWLMVWQAHRARRVLKQKSV
ncbi:RNA polymerase, sigma-24 subunit, ECF subfamily [Chthoniobacter flavus Ellin428]|uniref:RNA polymerase, sigma-24 subunit, ECF subfamily n=1 Tax=Chthoniobacter flavus Ellin428 TaxID=497964 RepID=B4CX17_9BACT|nr:sigma-70 family RNA polymerase sigma factor [Chthoniobacter flavus]EDY21337.1 RNA polymerase, sigma-24 subunit, ECF subfamily [Chthoniobacter flavus Ellin428]TCO84895.1 RNA polymerase sigma factor (sigma-70 family) [Chthoniobacter flavus]